MGIKIFLDTNILLDILDDKRPFHLNAVKIYKQVEADELIAFISETVLATTDYILQKATGKTLRIAMLSDLLDYLQLLPCTTGICQKVLRSSFSDLEDAILYEIAIENDLGYFITNDRQLLKNLSLTTVKVISSKEFLNINI